MGDYSNINSNYNENSFGALLPNGYGYANYDGYAGGSFGEDENILIDDNGIFDISSSSSVNNNALDPDTSINGYISKNSDESSSLVPYIIASTYKNNNDKDENNNNNSSPCLLFERANYVNNNESNDDKNSSVAVIDLIQTAMTTTTTQLDDEANYNSSAGHVSTPDGNITTTRDNSRLRVHNNHTDGNNNHNIYDTSECMENYNATIGATTTTTKDSGHQNYDTQHPLSNEANNSEIKSTHCQASYDDCDDDDDYNLVTGSNNSTINNEDDEERNAQVEKYQDTTPVRKKKQITTCTITLLLCSLLLISIISYFFNELFQYRVKINQLHEEVLRLSTKLQKYEGKEKELNSTTIDDPCKQLKDSNFHLTEANKELNKTLIGLQTENQNLSEQNHIIQDERDEIDNRLKETLEQLYMETKWFGNFYQSNYTQLLKGSKKLNTTLEEMQSQNENLKQQILLLQEQNDMLSNELLTTVADLYFEGEINRELNVSINEIVNRNQNLTIESRAFQKERDNLSSIVGSLSEEVAGLSNDIMHYESLNKQLGGSIEELDEQNQNLSLTVESYIELSSSLNSSIMELKIQNEVLMEQNMILQEANIELQGHNEILNASNLHYTELNSQLSLSIEALEYNNEALTKENDIYTTLNIDLNMTAQHLATEVHRLALSIEDLRMDNEILTFTIDSLTLEIDSLSDINNNLEDSISDLEFQIGELTNEIDALEVINNKLETTVSFVGETADSLDESFDVIISFLSEQITAYRSAIIEILYNVYNQRIMNWDCAFRDMFRLEDFINDGSMAIDEKNYPGVIEYINERVLSELCLNATDFEYYLSVLMESDNNSNTIILQQQQLLQTSPAVLHSVTTNDLITGIQYYTMAAMDYYFPDNDSNDSKGSLGLTQVDWAEASYDCKKLTLEKRFIYAHT